MRSVKMLGLAFAGVGIVIAFQNCGKNFDTSAAVENSNEVVSTLSRNARPIPVECEAPLVPSENDAGDFGCVRPDPTRSPLAGQSCIQYSELLGPARAEDASLYCVDWSRKEVEEYTSEACGVARTGKIQCANVGIYDDAGFCRFQGPSLVPGLTKPGKIIFPNAKSDQVRCLN